MTQLQPLMVCGASDVGLAREHNEDAFVIADLRSGEITSPCVRTDVSVSRDGFLLLVCDGMGGAAAGEVAARIAAESIKRKLVGDGARVAEHPSESLGAAVAVANAAVLEEARAHPRQKGMGTTCTAAIVLPESLIVAHVGDSRAYLQRGARLETLTRDQSVVSQLLEAGVLRPDQAAHHPLRHVLLQAVGTRSAVEPVFTEVSLRPGDRILICSDGLHGCVAHEQIAAVLRDAPDVAQATKMLIQVALRAGAPDNVTVVVADCEAREGGVSEGPRAKAQ
jgi:PPM family protein phosphatase